MTSSPAESPLEFLNELNTQTAEHAQPDLTSQQYHDAVFFAGDQILGSNFDPSVVEQAARPSQFNAALLSGVKLAKSRRILEGIETGVHLTTVFAMYKEVNRMSPKTEANPHGQDLWRRKMRELDWLFRGMDKHSWNLMACDDGCPQDSGGVSRGIIESEGWNNASVVFLQDAIDQKTENFTDLQTTKDSRKGGSIIYAMHIASQMDMDENKTHLVVYTDADLACSLAQSGMLIAEMTSNPQLVCAAGSRYGTPGAVLTYPDGRANTDSSQELDSDFRIPMMLRHRVRGLLIPPMAKVYDTQCAFKAFRRENVPALVAAIRDRGSSFDVELLLLIYKLFDQAAVTVAVLNVEDYVLSTFAAGGDDDGADGEDVDPFPYVIEMCKEYIRMYEMHIMERDPIVDGDRKAALDWMQGVTPKQWRRMTVKMEEKYPDKSFFLQNEIPLEEMIAESAVGVVG